MTFRIRNKLMIMCGDDIEEFKIAQSFVLDDENKLIVYSRCHESLSADNQKPAGVAKLKAQEIWSLME